MSSSVTSREKKSSSLVSKDKKRDKRKEGKEDLREKLKRKRQLEVSEHDDDHEEVNEVQEDFEIDSVGNVENSEDTLQKMKSAIIGILDDEIFSLSKKTRRSTSSEYSEEEDE